MLSIWRVVTIPKWFRLDHIKLYFKIWALQVCYYWLDVLTYSPVSVIIKLGAVADWTCGIAKSTLPFFLTWHSYSSLPSRLHFSSGFPSRLPKIITPLLPETGLQINIWEHSLIGGQINLSDWFTHPAWIQSSPERISGKPAKPKNTWSFIEQMNFFRCIVTNLE